MRCCENIISCVKPNLCIKNETLVLNGGLTGLFENHIVNPSGYS